jgi:uncharacterized Zn finger protein (UPF0148 family)
MSTTESALSRQSESSSHFDCAATDCMSIQVVCTVCNRDDDDESMLLCDGCDAGYHMGCLSPPLTSVPQGDWFCPPCDERQHAADDERPNSQVEGTNTAANTEPTAQIPTTAQTAVAGATNAGDELVTASPAAAAASTEKKKRGRPPKAAANTEPTAQPSFTAQPPTTSQPQLAAEVNDAPGLALTSPASGASLPEKKKGRKRDDYEEVKRMTADGSMKVARAVEAIAARTGRKPRNVSQNYYIERVKREGKKRRSAGDERGEDTNDDGDEPEVS